MSKDNTKVTLIVECLEVLKNYSSQEHPLSCDDIIMHMQEDYNHTACRQVISRYIKELNEIGIQITKEKRRYYYDDHYLLNEEVEVLCHSIMANSTIPLVYSKDLIDKLKKGQGVGFSSNKNLDFNIYNVDKRDNREIYLNIATISKAIDEGMDISFDYYFYDAKKRLVKKRDKRYVVTPCRTVAYQSRFYLIAYQDKYGDYSHYRIDKMKDVIIEKKSKNKCDIDPYGYTRHRLYMQSGPIEEYLIDIDRSLIDEVIDLFGVDTKIEELNNRYRVLVKTTRTALIYFACQFIEYVEVIEPIEVRDRIKEMLKKAVIKYGGK